MSILYESPALRDVTGPAIRPGGLALTERALTVCSLTPGNRVLDVGCGSGTTVIHLRQHYGLRAMGLDLSASLLAEGRAHPAGPPLVKGRAEALPVADGCLAAIFCECVLSLLTAPETAVAEWHRVLAQGGFLVVTDLYDRSDQREEESSTSSSAGCCLAGTVDRDTLLTRISAAGFEVVLFEDHTPRLKQLAAQLVWTHGSMAAFWSKAGFTCNGNGLNGRPGYCLVVARKKKENGWTT